MIPVRLIRVTILFYTLTSMGCAGGESVAPSPPDTQSPPVDAMADTGPVESNDTVEITDTPDGDGLDDAVDVSLDVDGWGEDITEIPAPVLCTEEDDPDAFCSNLLLPNICQTTSCSEDGSCEMEETTMPDCCVSDSQCDDDNVITFDQCLGGPLGCISVPDPLHCAEEKTLLKSTFADGTMQGWTVEDGDGDPFVGWRVMSVRTHQDSFAFAFRQAACPTYDSAGFAPDCETPVPGPGTKAQNGTLISPAISLPTDAPALLSFLLFAEMELVTDAASPCTDFPTVPDCFSPEIEAFFDNLTLEISTEGDEGPATEPIWSLVDLVKEDDDETKGTGGAFAHLAVDLAPWAGKTINLRFHVSIDDDTAYEGVYVDSVWIRTACPEAHCTTNTNCVSPDSCQSNECTPLIGGENGYCFGRRAFLNCIPCPNGTGLECEDGDVCTADFCGANQTCLHESTGVCCEKTLVGGLLDFETGTLPVGWEVSGGFGLVKWHVTDIDPHEGVYHLYFGNPITGHYDIQSRVHSALTTGFFQVPGTSLSTVVSFDLKLSTQYEAYPLSELNPDWDRLWIQVLDTVDGEGITTTVMDSLGPPFFGATGDGSGAGSAVYEYHGFDLTPWQGHTIRLRFLFDTLDAGLNTYGGVFIDNFAISTGCALDGCTSDAACVDETSCTSDACIFDTCTNVAAIPLCCEEAPDCFDGNPCTKHDCVEGACVLESPADPTCCFSDLSHSMNFEGDSPGWKFLPGGEAINWSIINAPVAFEGTGSLYFGHPITGLYAKASTPDATAQAVSPFLTLEENGTTTLSFQIRQLIGHHVATDSPADIVRVYVLTATEEEIEVWNNATLSSDTGEGYFPGEADLSSWAGETIQIAFESFTGTKTADASGGVWIDAITLSVHCPEEAP